MDKIAYYELLESKLPTYKEFKRIPVHDNGESLVPIGGEFEGKIQILEDYKKYTGNQIFVRSNVLKMLIQAQKALKEINQDYNLKILCGYRHPEIQEKTHNDIKQFLIDREPQLEGDDLTEAAHRFSAAPDVAGHPTGGAVDVRIIGSDGAPIDMGPAFVPDKDVHVFSLFVERPVWNNRQLLRNCMVKAGFAPFDGEWWHFSYGDREWANYYGKAEAIYQQIRFQL
ncbi:M15 family metallopeptidase [Brevibacillus choshinensis]|uniref:M15 family metallopeptidase n=1 Tax=Brevibacillus choshinensis TaxID=54911 RepID=UPI002E1A1C51|nr:M15 family metallopeptidase [Brevibacillus choshinensis]MED4582544.1 M15 family metallopeptidase [Brevibacillus choshinensis]